MKYLVAVFMAVYILFMGSVLAVGFIQKQAKEAELESSAPSQPTQATNPPAEQPSTPSQSPEPTGITTAEVAKHNKLNDCWIIISKNVYDVGKYLELHPGGADVIVPFCGKDATQAFSNQGGRGRHSSVANQELQNHLIGTLQ